MSKTETTNIFSERIKLLAEKMRDVDTSLSNKKQAEQMDIPYQTFNKYLNDDAECNITYLKTIANYYSVSTDFLLGVTDIQTKNYDTSAFCSTSGITENAAAHLLFTIFPDIFSRILESPFFDDFIRAINDLFEGSFALFEKNDIQKHELDYKIEFMRYNTHRLFDLVLNEFDRRELDEEEALEIGRITEEKDIELYQQIDSLRYEFYIATSESEKERLIKEIIEIRKQIAHKQTEGT